MSFLPPVLAVLKGNSVISKNKGTSLWNFVLNSRLRKFRHGISIVEMYYQLSSRKVDAQSVINWTKDEKQNSQFLRKSHYFKGYKISKFLASHLPVVCL